MSGPRDDRAELWLVGSLLLLLFLIGIPWAIADGLRGYNGGGHPDGTLEWIWRGSNLAPPLIPLLVLLAGLALALVANGRWRRVGDVVLVLVNLVFIASGIGEPFVPSEADSPGFLLVLYHLAFYVLCAGTAVLAIRDLLSLRPAPAAEVTSR